MFEEDDKGFEVVEEDTVLKKKNKTVGKPAFVPGQQRRYNN